MARVLRIWTLSILLAAFCIGAAAASQTVDVASHGKRFSIGSGDSKVTVLYLKGSPYEMGYAQGKLCAAEVRYLCQDVGKLMMLGMGCSPQKADATWALYQKHLRPDYIQELQGMADGSGVSLTDIERMHALPDISEWHCTFFAAIGKATRSGDLIQIRALDYTTSAGIQKYPALIVYDPTDGVPFV
ncbi:MAG TPA: hypothetical protein VGS41_09945, partial [Chthonomonadales bacterium]|nr:hypothetical protein [Chthonomonadales bacterium]